MAHACEVWLETWLDLSPDGQSVVAFDVVDGVVWEGGAPLEIPVTRRGPTDLPLTVGVTGRSGDVAVAPLEFGRGESTALLQVTAVQDDAVEGPEVVVLELARGLDFNVRGHVTLTIADDELPGVGLHVDRTLEGQDLRVGVWRDDCDDPAQITLSGAVQGDLDLALGESMGHLTAAAPQVTGAEQHTVTATLGASSTTATVWIDDDHDPDLVAWFTGPQDDQWFDASARAQHGTLAPADGPSWDAGALVFDGVDDTVIVGDLPQGDLTVAVSFRAEDRTDSYSYLISHGPYWWSGALNATLRLSPDGQLLAGGVAHAVVDMTSVDAAVSIEDVALEPGAACELTQGWDTQCVPCVDDPARTCMPVWVGQIDGAWVADPFPDHDLPVCGVDLIDPAVDDTVDLGTLGCSCSAVPLVGGAMGWFALALVRTRRKRRSCPRER